jgi:hypothetical protein
MLLYRLDAIRNYIVSKYNKPYITPETRKEVSDFFSPSYMVDRYELKEMFFENHYMTSFLVEEDDMMKHILNFNLKFNQNIPAHKVMKFSDEFASDQFHAYTVSSYPVNYNEIVETHYMNEGIQQLISLKKEAIRIDKERKTYFNSVMMDDFPSDIKTSKVLSLDFEYDQDQIYEFGLSLSDKGSVYDKYMITNLKTGSRDNQFQFQFGETNIVPIHVMVNTLKQYLGQADYLLLHGGYNDIALLNRFNISLEDFPNIKVLDTYHFYPKYFNNNSQDNSTLLDILNRFGVEHKHLHNAGNDAHYTLELLMKMDHALEHGITLSNQRIKKSKTANKM